MTIGDPRKAIPLGVVAFGAIAFFAFRMIPKSIREQADQALGETQSEEIASQSSGDLPTHLQGDPFSHPMLATNDPTSQPPVQEPSSSAPGQPWAPFDLGSLPNFIDSPEVQPDENTGTGRELPQDAGAPQIVSIRLVGVMETNGLSALIAVGDGSPVRFRIGDELAGGIEVSAIRRNTVTVMSKGKSIDIAVGGSAEVER